MEVFKKIWKIIKWVLLGIIILFSILIVSILIQTKNNPNNVPSIFGYKPFIVLSGSMETEINTGDLAIVKNIDANNLKENDIIAFRDNENHVVTHRIVKIIYQNNEKKYITKGDNNNTNDSTPIDADKVEGIYVSKINGLGNVLMLMQKPLTLIIVICTILIIGIMWIMADNNKLSIDERKELEQLRKEKKTK